MAGILSILAFDIYALGRYLPKFSKERAEWYAFRRTLHDYAFIREKVKNNKELESWLVYANALESPESIEQVIEDTNKRTKNIQIENYHLFSPAFLTELIDARIEEINMGKI